VYNDALLAKNRERKRYPEAHQAKKGNTCQGQSENAQKAGKRCTGVASGIGIFKQSIVSLNLLLHILLTLLKTIALALDVNDSTMVAEAMVTSVKISFHCEKVLLLVKMVDAFS